MHELIQRIEELREAHGIPRKELARLVGVPEATIRNWIRGSEPSIIAVSKIAEYFKISVDVLLYGESKDLRLNKDEVDFINKLRSLDDRDKNAVDVLVTGLNNQYQQSGKKYFSFDDTSKLIAENNSEYKNKLV